MNSFEERLGAALADAEAFAPDADPGAGRAVFREYVRVRRQRGRLTVAMRLAVVTIVATVGGAAIYTRVDDAPTRGNTPVVTPPDPGQQNVGQDDGTGNGSSCLRRSFGGCPLPG